MLNTHYFYILKDVGCIMRVAIYQMMDRGDAALNINAVHESIINTNADVFCLPEYFSIPADYKKRDKTLEDAWRETSLPAIEMLREVSREFGGYIIGGSVVEKYKGNYYNTCFIFKNGEIVAKYRKINLVEEEIKMGISPGNKTISVKTTFGKFGVLICADCLNDKTVEEVAKRNDFIFLPISLTDPTHPKVEGHPVSERIAREFGVTVIKISRVAFGLGAKSAIVTPKGVVWEAKKCCEEELILAEI